MKAARAKVQRRTRERPEKDQRRQMATDESEQREGPGKAKDQ